MDPIPLLIRLAIRRRNGADPADLAADFHASVARATEVDRKSTRLNSSHRT